MAFVLGYNTNVFAHHRLTDAIELLGEMGYRSVAITLDHHALNPFGPDLASEITEVRRRLEVCELTCVVETGSRFLLDRQRKHWPTLLCDDPDDRKRRLDFLQAAVNIASDLGGRVVSIWSGAADPGADPGDAWSRLQEGCAALLDHAKRRDVAIAFEPEPGMFVETMDQYRRLAESLDHSHFGLCLDVGHVHCLQDGTPAGRIREFADHLLNVHIEDMKAGRHDHLMFGEGELLFEPIFDALKLSGYSGTVNVELSRHSHDAVNAAQRSLRFLKALNG